MFSKSKRMYSWEIITINCHSEKSFFFHFLLLPNEREYIFTNLFILMHQKVLTSRILLISSSISFFMWELSVCRSLSLYTRAPIWRRKQITEPCYKRWYMYHLLDDNYFSSQAPTTVPRKITHTFSQSSTKRNCTRIAKVD